GFIKTWDHYRHFNLSSGRGGKGRWILDTNRAAPLEINFGAVSFKTFHLFAFLQSPMYVSRLIPNMLRKTDEKTISIPRKNDSEQKNTVRTRGNCPNPWAAHFQNTVASPVKPTSAIAPPSSRPCSNFRRFSQAASVRWLRASFSV